MPPQDAKPYYGLAEPPHTTDLAAVREAARACQACHLWRLGTQTVFGEGPPSARLMLIGEQPGDREDLAGHPFVGPAGRVLDAALERAGIPKGEVYVTNAVKHFKWIAKGPRRLHQKPNRGEVRACAPWLDVEIELVDPEVLVCLGATAAQAVLGAEFKLTQHRGDVLRKGERDVIATLHPSAILRMQERDAREAALESLVRDLKIAFARTE